MCGQTDESLHRKQSTRRFLKMYKHWNFGQEKENTDTCMEMLALQKQKQRDKVCGNRLR